MALSFHGFDSISWHSIWGFFSRLLYSFQDFFSISNFFGPSTTEETWVVEMYIWCIEIQVSYWFYIICITIPKSSCIHFVVRRNCYAFTHFDFNIGWCDVKQLVLVLSLFMDKGITFIVHMASFVRFAKTTVCFANVFVGYVRSNYFRLFVYLLQKSWLLKWDRPSAKRNNSSLHSVFFQALFC
jgi:hypothetical protein